MAAGALASVEKLLSLGADVTAADASGDTALHVAAAAERPRCVAALLRVDPEGVRRANRAGSCALEGAAEAGALRCCGLLLESRADVDAQSRRGRTALHAATRAGQVEACRLLVEAGCRLTLLDLSERRADEMVPEARHAELAWLVERAKAEVAREKAAGRR